MERENQYSRYYKNYAIAELNNVVVNKADYNDEAVLAALTELKKRDQVLSNEQLQLLDSLEGDFKQKTLDINKSLEKEVESKVLPEWYSPAAVLGFSIFFSLLFGAILMYLNLSKSGKNCSALFVTSAV